MFFFLFFFEDSCINLGEQNHDSSDQLQISHHCLFGIEKKAKFRINFQKGLNEQSEELINTLNLWNATTTPYNS